MRAGRSVVNLGNTYYWMGDFDKAIKYHTQHLAIAKEVRDLKGEGRAYGNLRIAYQRAGRTGTSGLRISMSSKNNLHVTIHALFRLRPACLAGWAADAPVGWTGATR